MDDDDLLDDDIFTENVLNELARQESQYFSTQQQLQQQGNQAGSVIRDSTSNATPTIVAPIIVRDRDEFAWSAQSIEDDHRLREAEDIIEGLKFTIERLQNKQTQSETARDYALRELERCRTELNFKNQELESTHRELRSARSQARRGDESQQAMLVDDFLPLSTPKKRSFFPNTDAFSPMSQRRAKRPAPFRRGLTSSPSAERLGTPALSDFPSPATEPPAKVAATPQRTPVDDRRADDTVRRHMFYARLFGGIYLEWRLENSQRAVDPTWNLTPSLISFLAGKLSQTLAPPKCVKEADKKLLLVASDIAECITQTASVDLSTTIQRLLYLLCLSISICQKEKVVTVLARVVRLVHILVMHYHDASRYLIQDLQRAEESSVLWNLAAALAQLPVAQTHDNLSSKPQLLRSLPDISNMSFKDLATTLGTYNITAKELYDATHSTLTHDESVNVVCNILDVFIHSVYQPTSSSFSQFVLRHDGLSSLLSTSKPIPVILKTLVLFQLAVGDEWPSDQVLTDLVPLSRYLNPLLLMAKPPQEDAAEDWYLVRIRTMAVWGALLSSQPAGTPFAQCAQDLLQALLQLTHTECLRLRSSHQPPFEPQYTQFSSRLLDSAMTLAHHIVRAFPSVLRAQDGEISDMAFNVLDVVTSVAREEWGEDHQVHHIIRSLENALQQPDMELVE